MAIVETITNGSYVDYCRNVEGILRKEDNTTKATLNRYLARFSKWHVGKGRT